MTGALLADQIPEAAVLFWFGNKGIHSARARLGRVDGAAVVLQKHTGVIGADGLEHVNKVAALVQQYRIRIFSYHVVDTGDALIRISQI